MALRFGAGIGFIFWQFRRFRFAVEVDCDRRVLANADPIAYAQALLTIAGRRCGLLIGAPALVEQPSNLERRIQAMTAEAHRPASLRVQLPVVAAVCRVRQLVRLLDRVRDDRLRRLLPVPRAVAAEAASERVEPGQRLGEAQPLGVVGKSDVAPGEDTCGGA